MLQESKTEEESQVTLTGFAGNMIRIGGQIRLLGIVVVTGMDTQVSGQIGLLGTAGVIGMVAQVNRQIGLLGSARITRTAT
jgi:hypothetical protein